SNDRRRWGRLTAAAAQRDLLRPPGSMAQSPADVVVTRRRLVSVLRSWLSFLSRSVPRVPRRAPSDRPPRRRHAPPFLRAERRARAEYSEPDAFAATPHSRCWPIWPARAAPRRHWAAPTRPPVLCTRQRAQAR